jgi:hypothetical protein
MRTVGWTRLLRRRPAIRVNEPEARAAPATRGRSACAELQRQLLRARRRPSRGTRIQNHAPRQHRRCDVGMLPVWSSNSADPRVAHAGEIVTRFVRGAIVGDDQSQSW